MIKRDSKKTSGKRWSADVMRRSNALDLQRSVFTWSDPSRIARSLKNSAKKSRRRKGTEYQSAMSMLNFYINRAGKNLPARRHKVLEEAKEKLRSLYHKKNEKRNVHPGRSQL